MRTAVTAAVITAALCATCTGMQAQTYPAREMKLVVGLPAGSGGDVITRYYADQLSRLSGKPVIVENKPGMILSLGADAVAKAAPDGYTILITSVTSSHAANLYNFKKLPYDPIRDFTPVALLQRSYFILMVRPESGWTTVTQLTAAMKSKGARASYGYGSPPALASAELYKARAGLQAVGIPYRSSINALPQMLSGELDFQFIGSTQGTPLLEGGKLRGLAVTSRERVSGVDLPPMALAAAIAEFDIAPAWGVFLPAGAPAAVVVQLQAWFLDIVKMEATQRFLATSHAAAFPGGSRDLADFLPKEIKKWEELSRIAKIEPQ